MAENKNIKPYFPARALISKSAFVHNLRLAQKIAGKAEVMAVVKADAYGHGATQISKWAIENGIHWLAVAHISEALELRRVISKEHEDVHIFSLIATPGAQFADAILNGVDLSLSAPWALDAITTAAKKTGRTARIHLEVDTGMARGGFNLDELREIAPKIKAYCASGILKTIGLWSHFARAGEVVSPATDRQVALFEEAKEIMEAAGLSIQHFHISASAGLVWHPKAQYTMVRPGGVLYGLSPESDTATAAKLGFKPVMELTAEVASIREVPAGTGVSYGHTAVTEKNMCLATVPLGYADGIPRTASNFAQVLAGGVRRKIIGRVCMDQFVIDGQKLRPGDLVTLFGGELENSLTADDWAAYCNTIGYEIVSRIGSRVPRQYVD